MPGPDDVKVKYSTRDGRTFTYEELRGAGWKDSQIDQLEKAYQISGTDYLESELKNGGWQPSQLQQLYEKTKEADKRYDRIKKGDYEVRRNRDGEMQAKLKDANDWKDVKEITTQNPKEAELFDQAALDFEKQFGKVELYDASKQKIVDVRNQMKTELDKQYQEFGGEDAFKKYVMSGTWKKEAQRKPGEDAGVDFRVQRAQKIYDMRKQVYEYEKLHGKEGLTFYDHTQDMIKNAGKTHGARIGSSPVYAAQKTIDDHEGELVNYAEGIDKQILKSQYDLQKVNEELASINALQGEEAKGKADQKSKLVAKQGELTKNIASYNAQRSQQITEQILATQKQIEITEDPTTKKELERQVDNLVSMNKNLLQAKSFDQFREMETDRLIEKYNPNIMSIRDVIPKDATPSEALEIYYATLLQERNTLMQKLNFTGGLKDQFRILRSAVFSSEEEERLMGVDGVIAQIKELAVPVLMNKMPIKYARDEEKERVGNWWERTQGNIVRGVQVTTRDAMNKLFPLQGYGGDFEGIVSGSSRVQADEMRQLSKAVNDLQLNQYTTEGINEVIEDREKYKNFTAGDWGRMMGPVVAIAGPMALGGYGYTKALTWLRPLAELERIGKTGIIAAKVLKPASKAGQLIMRGKRLVVRGAAQTIESGLQYQTTGWLFSGNKTVADEADFLSGFFGKVGEGTVVKIGSKVWMPPVFKKLFGENSGKLMQYIAKRAKTNIGGGFGETAEETLQTMYQLYRDSPTYKDFEASFKQQFGTMDERLHFFGQVFAMGAVMRSSGDAGRQIAQYERDLYNTLPPEQQKVADKISEHVTNKLNRQRHQEAVRLTEDFTDESLSILHKDALEWQEKAQKGKDQAEIDEANETVKFYEAELKRRGIREEYSIAQANLQEMKDALEVSKRLGKESPEQLSTREEAIKNMEIQLENAKKAWYEQTPEIAKQEEKNLLKKIEENRENLLYYKKLQEQNPDDPNYQRTVNELSEEANQLQKRLEFVEKNKVRPKPVEKTEETPPGEVKPEINEEIAALRKQISEHEAEIGVLEGEITTAQETGVAKIYVNTKNKHLAEVKKKLEAANSRLNELVKSQEKPEDTPEGKPEVVQEADARIAEVEKRRAAEHSKYGSLTTTGKPRYGEENREYNVHVDRWEGEYSTINTVHITDKDGKIIVSATEKNEVPWTKVREELKKQGFADDKISEIVKGKSPIIGINPTKAEIDAKFDDEIRMIREASSNIPTGQLPKEVKVQKTKEENIQAVSDAGYQIISPKPFESDNSKRSTGGTFPEVKKNLEGVKMGDVLDVEIKYRKDFTPEELEFTNTRGAVYEHIMRVVDANGNQVGGIPYLGKSDLLVRNAIKEGKTPRILVKRTYAGEKPGFEFEVIIPKSQENVERRHSTQDEKAIEKISQEEESKRREDESLRLRDLTEPRMEAEPGAQNEEAQGQTYDVDEFSARLHKIQEDQSDGPKASLMTSEVPGTNISSNTKGIGGALTNPTVLSKQKGNIGKDYPVTFRGKTYVDAEAAYQANKKGDSSDFSLMTDVIEAKLRQYPALTDEITRLGGTRWILASWHSINSDYDSRSRWTGQGKNSKFIVSLKDAYERIVGSKDAVKVGDQQEAIKTNFPRLMALLGPKMYNSNISNVAVKELLQNAFDATKQAAKKGMYSTSTTTKIDLETGQVTSGNKPTIDVHFDTKERTITVTDNGIGMTPDIVRNAFFAIADTNKEGLDTSERSGGFGLAKIQYLFSSEQVELTTVRDGIKTTVTTNQDELLSGSYNIHTELTNEKPGTTVRIKVPQFMIDNTGKRDIWFPGRYDKPKFLSRPLLGDVTVTTSTDSGARQTLEMGTGFDLEGKFNKLATIDTEWGTIDVHLALKRVDQYTGPKHMVFSSGFFQFDTQIRENPMNYDMIPHDIIINIRPKVDADSIIYPFDNSRENFSVVARKDFDAVKEVIQTYFRKVMAAENAETFKTMQPMTRIEGRNMTEDEIQNAQIIVNKALEKIDKAAAEQLLKEILSKPIAVKEGKIVDEKLREQTAQVTEEAEAPPIYDFSGVDRTVPQFHNNLNVDILALHPDMQAAMTEMGNILMDFVKDYARINNGYKDILSNAFGYIFGVSLDKSYLGVHVYKPFRAIFINPIIRGATTPVGRAHSLFDVLAHELTHFTQGGHNANFVLEMHTVMTQCIDSGLYDKYMARLVELTKRYEQALTLYNDEYDKYTTKNLGASFEREINKAGVPGDRQSAPELLRERGIRAAAYYADPGPSAPGDGDSGGGLGEQKTGPTEEVPGTGGILATEPEFVTDQKVEFIRSNWDTVINELATLASDISKRGFTSTRSIIATMKMAVLRDSPFGKAILKSNIFDLEREEILKRSGLYDPETNQLINYEADQTMEFFTSAEQKVESLRRIFKEFFEQLKIENVHDPERTVWKLSRRKDFQRAFKNRESIQKFLKETLMNENPVLAGIMNDGSIITYKQLLSLKNIYASFKILPVIGLTQRGNGIWVMHNINQNARYYEFERQLKRTINTFTYGTIRDNPNKAIAALYNEYFRGPECKEAQIRRDTPDAQKRAKLEELYLEFLSRLTGIHSEVWKGYINLKNEADYMAGGDKLAIIHFMIHNDGPFEKDANSLAKNMISYFVDRPVLKNGKKGPMSNLMKLVNTAADEDSLAISFDNIMSNKQTSFEQISDLTIALDNIQNLSGSQFYNSNRIVQFHAKNKSVPKLVKLNGIFDTITGRALESDNIPKSDVRSIFMALFNMDKDTYLQYLGQFADKKQFYLVEVPKYQDAKSKYLEEYEKSPYKKQMASPKQIEGEIAKYDKIMSDEASQYNEARAGGQEGRIKFIENFLYNFALNKYELDLIIHGKPDQYKNTADMIKRAGSSNSPGYIADTNIEGGIGETQRHAIVNEYVVNIDGADRELFDGIQFMSSKFADKLMISMGGILSQQSKYGDLNTAKPLYSRTDENGTRGLTKTNLVVIYPFAQAFPGSVYEKIYQYMSLNDLDTLSFTSGTKKADAPINIVFDEKGNWVGSTKKAQWIDRPNDHFFIQQDLRHPTYAETKKQPKQSIGNFLPLPSAAEVSKYWLQISNESADMIREHILNLPKAEYDDVLLKEIDPDQLSDLYDYIKAGGSEFNPYYDRLIQKIKASMFTRMALERQINRVALQEVPSADIPLHSFRIVKDSSGKEHALLPEVILNINGIRYEKEFDSREDAMLEIRRKKGRYADLYDMEGNIKEWELEERGGKWYIPGEMLMYTRVPADHLHSHTIARAKRGVPGAGNIIMTDHTSQIIAGPDFDGDKRFVETFYKDKDGNIITDMTTKKGLVNRSLLLEARDYQDPTYLPMIVKEINVKAYKDTVDRIKKEMKADQATQNLPEDVITLHEQNVIGNNLISILANFNTTYDFIKLSNLQLKTQYFGTEEEAAKYFADYQITKDAQTGQYVGSKKIELRVPGGRTLKLGGFNTDNFGIIKSHIGNFENMALDNGKDPAIGYLGVSEPTATMFMTTLVMNEEFDKIPKDQLDEAIVAYVDVMADYFNSPLVRRFVEMEKERKRPRSTETIKDTFAKLENEGFDRRDIGDLRRLYYLSKETDQIFAFINLSREVPNNVPEFVDATNLRNKIYSNGLISIDVSPMYEQPTDVISNMLDLVDLSVDMARDYVLNNTFETSYAMQSIIHRFEQLSDDPFMSKDRIDLILKKTKALAILKFGLKTTQTIEELGKDLHDYYRENYLTNKFLSYLSWGLVNEKLTLQLAENYHRQIIPDSEMDKIHQDFNKIPREIQDKLMAYSIAMFGINVSTWKGNYANLFSLEYQSYVGKMMEDNINKEMAEQMTDEQIDEIIEDLRYNEAELDGNKTYKHTGWKREYIDINARKRAARTILAAMEGRPMSELGQVAQSAFKENERMKSVYDRLFVEARYSPNYKSNDDIIEYLKKIEKGEDVKEEIHPNEIPGSANVIEDFTGHSGGAEGADEAWHMIGQQYGITKFNHYLYGDQLGSAKLRMNGIMPTKISKEMLIQGYLKYIRANRKLRRKELKLTNEKSYKPARNWYQVKHSGAVYAIGTILKPGEAYTSRGSRWTNQSIRESVSGGTGYAVQMAIDAGRTVYVFDQNKKMWFEWSGTQKRFLPISTPILTPNFAAIGTREINPDGIQAIRDVYEKTIAQLNQKQLEGIAQTPSELYTVKINDRTYGLVVKDGVVVAAAPSGKKYIQMNFNDVLKDIKDLGGEITDSEDLPVTPPEPPPTNPTGEGNPNGYAEDGNNPFDRSGPSIFDEDATILQTRRTPLDYSNDQVRTLLAISDFIRKKEGQDFFLMAGYAGTGKTTIIENIYQYARNRGWNVMVAAPTNKAINVIKSKFPYMNLLTLHKFLYGVPDERTGEWKLRPEDMPDLLIIDESSMIAKPEIDALREAMQNYGPEHMKVIFIGDSFQLEPVGNDPRLFAWEAYNDWVKAENKSLMKEVRRQGKDSGILKVATAIRDSNSSMVPFDSYPDFIVHENSEPLGRQFLKDLKEGRDSVLIVGTNQERETLNKTARATIYGPNRTVLEKNEKLISLNNNGEYSNGEIFQIREISEVSDPFVIKAVKFTKTGERQLVEHRIWRATVETADGVDKVVYIFPNIMDPSIHLRQIDLYNNDILNEFGDIQINKFTRKKFLNPAIATATYGYVITGHKSQGSQWANVYVDPTGAVSQNVARWIYTSVTRAAQKVEIRHVQGKTVKFNNGEIEQRFLANSSSPEIEHMLTVDAISEELAKNDPETQDFIAKHFQAVYPELKVFSTRKAFLDYVRKCFGDTRSFNMSAIGAAFGNAIFIDPESSVQSTFFHENTHLYWNALPIDHVSKKRLTEMFGSEEQAILAIGRAGYDLAFVKMKPGFTMEKFQLYLKTFWRAVKALIGKESREDLAISFARKVWNNKDNVKFAQFGQKIINHMDNEDKIMFEEDVHEYWTADHKIQFTSANQLIKLIQLESFDTEAESLRQVSRENMKRREKGETSYTREERIKRADEIRHQWELDNRRGTALHDMINRMRTGKESEITDEWINEHFASKEAYQQFRQAVTNFFEAVNPNAMNHEISEEMLYDFDSYMAGHADHQIEEPEGVHLMDFKCSRKSKYDKKTGKLSENYTKAFGERRMRRPFADIKDSKHNRHKIQLNIYRELIKRMKGKDVYKMSIIPIKYDVDDTGKITGVTFEDRIPIPLVKAPTLRLLAYNKRLVEETINSTTNDDEALLRVDKRALEEQRMAIKELTAALPPGTSLGDLDKYPEVSDRIFRQNSRHISSNLTTDLGFDENDLSNKDMLHTLLHHWALQVEKPSGSDNTYRVPWMSPEQYTALHNVKDENRIERFKSDQQRAKDIYDKIGTISKLESLSAEELWYYEERLRSMTAEAAGPLIKYIADTITKRMIVKQVAKENKPGNKDFKLATIVLNDIRKGMEIVMDDKSIPGDINAFFAFFLNDRFINQRHKMLQLYTTIVREQSDKVDTDRFMIHQRLQELFPKVNMSAITTWHAGKLHYKNEYDDSMSIADQELLSLIYELYAKYNNYHRFKANMDDPEKRIQPMIPVPMVKMTKFSMFTTYGMKGLLYDKYFSPQPYDYEYVNWQGERMSLYDVKMYFDIETDDLGELKKAIRQAKMLHGEIVSKERPEKEPTHVKIYGDPKSMLKFPVSYETKRGMDVLEQHLISMSMKFHMEKVIPFYKYVEQIYSSTGTLTNYTNFLRSFTRKRVFGKTKKVLGKASGVVSGIMTLAALKSLALNVTAQIINFGIGQYGNYVQIGKQRPEDWRKFVPYDFMIGWKRVTTNWTKVNAIMDRLGILDVTNEYHIDSVKKAQIMFNRFAFSLINVVEHLNHGVATAGMLTKEQWDAFNQDGTLKEGSGFQYSDFTNQARRILENDVRETHGDYGDKNMAAGNYVDIGKVITMFRNWMASFVMTHFARSYVDSNGIRHKGMFTTAKHYILTILYDIAPDAIRRQQLGSEYKDASKDEVFKRYQTMTDEELNRGIRDYIKAAEDGKISFKDLSHEDRANLGKFVKTMAVVVPIALYQIMSNVKDDDDEEKKKKSQVQQLLWDTLALRFFGDILMFYDITGNITQMIGRPVPALGYLEDVSYAVAMTYAALGEFVGENIMGKEEVYPIARYKNDSPPYGKAGELKMWNAWLRVLPFGALVYQIKRFEYARQSDEEKKEKRTPRRTKRRKKVKKES